MSNQNIYDTANQLEREMRQLPELETIRQALKAIDEHAESKQLFEQYKQTIQLYSLRESQGQPLNEEEMKQIDDLSKAIMENDLIKSLIDAERRMDQVIRDLNRVITKPLQELYQGQQ